jgi:endonuclease-3
LKNLYPAAVCALEWCDENHRNTTHESPTRDEGYLPSQDLLRESWKLLVMGRLSAQCTDARVNIVCRELFEKFPTAESMASGDIADIEAIVRPCGLYHTKAQNIKEACAILVDQHNGIVPCDSDALLALPGVGRKIANLLMGDVYRVPGVVADTHCIRICGRLGFYPEEVKDPNKVENIMSQFIEPREQSDFCVLYVSDIGGYAEEVEAKADASDQTSSAVINDAVYERNILFEDFCHLNFVPVPTTTAVGAECQTNTGDYDIINAPASSTTKVRLLSALNIPMDVLMEAVEIIKTACKK